MKSTYLIPLSCLLFAATLLQAQPHRFISLQEAMQMGLEYSHQLKIDNDKADVLKTKLAQQRNSLMPTLSLTSAFTRISNNVKPFEADFGGGSVVLNPQILNQNYNTLSLEQIVFAGNRGNNYLASTSILEQAARLDYEKDKQEIMLNVVNAYIGYFKSQQMLQVINENIKLLNARLKDITNFEKQGLALHNDVLRAQLTLSNSEVNKAEAESAIQINNYNLNLILGLDGNTIIDVENLALLSTVNSFSTDSAMKIATENRSDIKAINYRMQAADKSVKIARGAYFPTVTAGAHAYYNNPNQMSFPLENAYKGTWDVGAKFVFNFDKLLTNRQNVAEANINKDQIAQQKNILSDGVKSEVNSAVNMYRLAGNKKQLSEQALEQATENQLLLKKQFDNDVKTFTDLLDADVLQFQSKINQANTQADLVFAYYKILKAIGTLK